MLFTIAHATADSWAELAVSCADRIAGEHAGASLGFVYATDRLAPRLGNILAVLRERTAISHWIGSVGIGICAEATEYFDCPALAVMTASLPEHAFRVFPALTRTVDQLPADQQRWIATGSATFGIVHGDPHNPRTPQLIADLAQKTSAFLIGGLTSSRESCHQVAGSVTGGGLSGVLFSGDVAVQTGLSQGCTPIGSRHIITDCLDNVIISLDGRPALEVFRDDIGELLARDLSRAAGYVHAAIPLPQSDVGDYLVRNLIGIDPVHGWLAIGERIASGSPLMFVRRDPMTARADLAAMLEKLRARLAGPPRGGVYFSCVARGPHMFGEAGAEMAVIRDALGEVPVVGFYGNGEISNGRLYGYTGVLALFS
jgi:small ligand-binding sensory domain FIST